MSRASSSVLLLLPALAVAFGAAAACEPLPDPVHDDAVARLGPEGPMGAGALHRPGQPCATCHGPAGPASSDFSVAGTVFAAPGSLVGVEGARLELVDATGSSPPQATSLVTNCVGNFWVRHSTWDPIFPVRVVVVKGDTRRAMQSDIGHDASCAGCHAKAVSDPLAQLGPVWLFETADPAGPPRICPVDPNAGAR